MSSPKLLRIGVLIRTKEHFSLLYYRDKVFTELARLGAAFFPFPEDASTLPACDLVWDPGGGMRKLPRQVLETDLPTVVTIHGLRAFTLPPEKISREPAMVALREELLQTWLTFGKKVKAVISVSGFGAREVMNAFGLPATIVHPIYHGVDRAAFSPSGDTLDLQKPYFFNVSLYQPKKNVDRIIAAYNLLREEDRPDLMVVSPGYAGDRTIFGRKGVNFSDAMLSHRDLAKRFRGALCFVFPSLHETFGLSIIEAMACGCPVVTSRITACSEIAANAALLVDPYSVDDIAHAMRRCAEDPFLRKRLAAQGIARAEVFTWERSGEEHLKVFQKVVEES